MNSIQSSLNMWLIKTLVLSICLIFDINALECEDSRIHDAGPLVTTESGKIIGQYQNVLDGKVAAFLGIPFAEPPLGSRRFTKPSPNKPWTGIREAQHLPPPCMQYSSRNFSWVPDIENATEDCLYLNVWVPMNRCYLEKLPVMVWIYGGGFTTGSSGMDLYDGRVIASTGDVIVVSFNYRAGVFGFFNGGTPEAPGNVAMHDQVLALKWVHQNIRHFNGNPDSVTVFGESAGAMSIGFHMVSPLSRGLFHRAILQSGSPFILHLVDDDAAVNRKTNKFAQMAGCANETFNMTSDASYVIDCLKNKDARELALVEDEIVSKTMSHLLPSVDNDFIAQHPMLSYESGDYVQVPILIGVAANETTIIMNLIRPDLFSLHEPFSENATSLEVAKQFVNLFKIILDMNPDPIFDFYFGNDSKVENDEVVRQTEKVFGDSSFYCPSLFLAEKMETVFMYWMTHRSEKSPLAEWVGTPHFEDVQYVFGKPLIDLEHYTPEDTSFSVDIIKKWTNFAKNGSPQDPSSDQPWPVFKSTEPTIMELTSREPRLLEFPSLRACEFWRALYNMNTDGTTQS